MALIENKQTKCISDLGAVTKQVKAFLGRHHKDLAAGQESPEIKIVLLSVGKLVDVYSLATEGCEQ